MNAHSSLGPNGQKVEAAQMPVNEQMGKQSKAYSNPAMLLDLDHDQE